MTDGNFVSQYQMDATRMHFHKFITFTLLGPSLEKRFQLDREVQEII